VIQEVLKTNHLEAEKIILFGSRARGEQRKVSDWDILLVVKQDIDRKTKKDLFKEITEKLSHYLIPCDVIIKSIKELEFYKDFYGTATYEALKEGTCFMNEKVKLWLIKAFEDYISIKTLLDSPLMEYTTSIICFHSQQMVEKLLKAFLTYHNIQFPRTHLLETLRSNMP
jgi:predicted nucleotidyltransferase